MPKMFPIWLDMFEYDKHRLKSDLMLNKLSFEEVYQPPWLNRLDTEGERKTVLVVIELMSILTIEDIPISFLDVGGRQQDNDESRMTRANLLVINDDVWWWFDKIDDEILVSFTRIRNTGPESSFSRGRPALPVVSKEFHQKCVWTQADFSR